MEKEKLNGYIGAKTALKFVHGLNNVATFESVLPNDNLNIIRIDVNTKDLDILNYLDYEWIQNNVIFVEEVTLDRKRVEILYHNKQ